VSISADTRRQVRERAGFACEYCGVSETDAGGELTIDHFQPRTCGGTDDTENLLYCCHRCNEYKAGYWPERPDDTHLQDDFDAAELRPEWQWHDPVQVSAYSLSERPGHLVLRPGPGVDLGPGSNLNAPRMLLEVSGDFALETRTPADRGRTAGGLLIWKDVLNYVRLDGIPDGLGGGEIRLEARVAGAHDCFGRGHLWGDTYYLRLERTGDRFAALCSTDGVQWLTCGYVDLPVKDPLWVGEWAGSSAVVYFDYVQVLGRG
jgi:beta-xylosidase-like protein/HNH endonuclease